VEDKPLEICMDIPFDLKPAKLNEEGLLQSTCQIDLMKDAKRSARVAKGSDVHVKPKGAYMLMQKNVSLKELNLLKKNE
jgi:hypothetical protein